MSFLTNGGYNSDREKHIVLSADRASEIVNSTDKRDAVFGHIGKNLRKGSFLFAFRTQIFISRNCPFFPAVGCFGIVCAFHTGKIQSAGEIDLPWLKRAGKIGHQSQDTDRIAVLIAFGEMPDFVKMSVGICL